MVQDADLYVAGAAEQQVGARERVPRHGSRRVGVGRLADGHARALSDPWPTNQPLNDSVADFADKNCCRIHIFARVLAQQHLAFRDVLAVSMLADAIRAGPCRGKNALLCKK